MLDEKTGLFFDYFFPNMCQQNTNSASTASTDSAEQKSTHINGNKKLRQIHTGEFFSIQLFGDRRQRYWCNQTHGFNCSTVYHQICILCELNLSGRKNVCCFWFYPHAYFSVSGPLAYLFIYPLINFSAVILASAAQTEIYNTAARWRRNDGQRGQEVEAEECSLKSCMSDGTVRHGELVAGWRGSRGDRLTTRDKNEKKAEGKIK